jgi:hypothetical protein
MKNSIIKLILKNSQKINHIGKTQMINTRYAFESFNHSIGV